MPEKEIIRIRVEDREVGVVGLREAIEQVSGASPEISEHEIKEQLLSRLSMDNYIPGRVRALYGEALYREYRRYLGDPAEREVSRGLRIRVLGTGCAQCSRLAQELIEVVAALGLDADIEHVTDIQEIARSGVMGMPALLVNGEVKCVGRVPTRNQLEAWFLEARR